MLWKFLLLITVIIYLTPVTLYSKTDTLTIMYYNLLNYPGSTQQRVKYLQTIVHFIKPDIMAVTELQSAAGADILLSEAFNTRGINYYKRAEFTDGFDSDNGLFYNSVKISLKSQDTIQTALRLINEYILYYNNQVTADKKDTIFMDFFSMHLKSDAGSQQKRYDEVLNLKNHFSTKQNFVNVFAGGDMNFYTSEEPAYDLIVNNGLKSLYDPANAPGNWSDNLSFANLHSQSTRVRAFEGGTIGGLDDRFDFIFVSNDVLNGFNKLSYVPNSYSVFGNDGKHFNDSITAPPSNPLVPDSVILALHNMTDHLPVIMKVKINLPDNENVMGCKDLFISEYLEGSNSNQSVEIYNPSGNELELSPYSLKLFHNGSTQASVTLGLKGKLPSGFFYIITNPNATLQTLISENDTSPSSFSFSGNSAIGLYRNDTLIDLIGKIGENPATGWNVSSGSTIDFTLRRKSDIRQGNINWDDGKNEWEVFPTDNDSDFGKHLSVCRDCNLSFTSNVNPVVCTDSSNGKIELTPFSSFPPFSHIWSNGSTAEDISGLIPGKYNFLLKDKLGCMVSDTLLVNLIPSPMVIITDKEDVCAGGCDGFIKVVVSGGTGNIKYKWNDPFGQSTDNAKSLCKGIYTVTINDANNCLDKISNEIIEWPTPVASYTFNKQNKKAFFTNTSSYTNQYFWDFGDGQTDSVSDPIHQYLSYGTYPVIYIASNDCTADTNTSNIEMILGISEELLNQKNNLPGYYYDALSDNLHILLPQHFNNGRYSLIDLRGIEIVTAKIPPATSDILISVESLPSGIYILQLISRNRTYNLLIPLLK